MSDPITAASTTPRLLSQAAAAAFLGVSRDKLRDWYRTGALPADVTVQIGETVYYRLTGLRRLTGEEP